MSELGTLQRPSTPSRRRGEQRRLGLTDAEPTTLATGPLVEEGPPPVRFPRPRKAKPAAKAEPAKPDRTPPPPVFHPLAYRSVVAAWSLESRERWGRRANDLEDAGLSWRDAETQAFVEVWNDLRRAGGYADPDR
ncbi:hypothetical protein [Paludisphaera rhizosphaerae]|uniref:hypothetical protein n=1 Tax=Paludisphaera rhizosphaerae TaxID=2711216 RepID=UPI0013EE1D80|nr:hypothetical protein [Paludisphaera rhizosphaerae]